MLRSIILLAAVNCMVWVQSVCGQTHTKDEVSSIIDQEYHALKGLYEHLHANPELSFQEKETSRLLSDELQALGFSVVERVGGYGVVGVLENGMGPTVMVRADMDALPIKEETGLPYSSQVMSADEDGELVPVMHACGHDFHMAAWVGVAKVLSQLRSSWSGTLVFVGQPAEEKGKGARAMIADGLFSRFPRPDFGLAMHVNPLLEAGRVGYTPGYSLANVDNMTIVVKGKGGHGAAPHTAIDPIVIASKIVLGLQTIVSRELSPIESPAVITVGAIHAGRVGNIISNEATMELTVRSFGDVDRNRILGRIQQTCHGIALASGLEEEDYPIVSVNEEYTPSVYNDPELTANAVSVFRDVLGEENVIALSPEMFGEDFSNYTRANPSIPTLIYSVGTSPMENSPSGKVTEFFPVHSSRYFPIIDPSLKVGVLSMSMAVIDLLKIESPN